MRALYQVSSQTIWQIIGKVLTSISTLLILGLIARNFNEDGTGLYTLAFTYFGFFYLASDLGLNAHILPLLLKDQSGNVFQKLFGFRLLLTISLVILSLLIALFWPNLDNDVRQAILIATVSIVCYGIYVTSGVLFQSRQRFDFNTLCLGAGALFTLGTVYLVTFINLPSPYLLLGPLAGWTATSALSLFITKRYTEVKANLDFSFIINIFKEAWPISLTLLLNLAYFKLDVFILSYFKPLSEVGIYNVAYQVFQSALVIPTFIMNSFYPLMLVSFTVSLKKLYKDMVLAILGMLMIAVIGLVFTFFLSPILISLITGGSGFLGSVTSLKILSIGFPAFFISSVLMWVLITLKKYKTMLLIYFLGFIVNTVLNLIFIPNYSYLAASYITVLSEYLILICQIIILIPTFKKLK